MRNDALIEALFALLTPVTIDTSTTDLITSIRHALITGLDPLISAGASIFCNQTGYDILTSILDGIGNPAINSDPVVRKAPPVMLPNRLWPDDTEAGTTPILVANGTELVTLFRRGVYEMASTNESANGWRKYVTEVRGIYRCDPELFDTEAGVLLAMPIPES